MRVKHPNICIFLLKLDSDAAYRRLHVTAAMTVLTITIIQKIAYILLRLPFGVSNEPNDHSVISESIFDLTNDILRDETYDPMELHSPLQTQLDKPVDEYDENEPFATARPLLVRVPFHYAMVDG